jgi:hypothetical protein
MKFLLARTKWHIKRHLKKEPVDISENTGPLKKHNRIIEEFLLGRIPKGKTKNSLIDSHLLFFEENNKHYQSDNLMKTISIDGKVKGATLSYRDEMNYVGLSLFVPFKKIF